ncbi:TPA: hypothetical protein L8N66_005365, partial [Klebsiella pneumoniae]|nr:hypothetical protein [Klebsiella pneumoniae]
FNSAKVRFIQQSRNSVDVNGSGEFLTESGKELIDELISELVEFVKKQKPVTAESGNE